MTEPLQGLPERTRRHLSELTETLRALLGADLAALLVYGSAARGGFQPEQSNVDLLLVLRAGGDETELLRRIGPALVLARHAARIETMLLRSDEIQRAADVFPLLYDDIRAHHMLLHGENPFAALVIHDAHRRVRIEQALREARLRGRRLFSDTTANPRALAAGLDRKLKQLRAPLHALLRLRGQGGSDDLRTVLGAVAARYRLDAAPLFRVPEDPGAAYAALGRLLDAAISDIDQDGPEGQGEQGGAS